MNAISHINDFKIILFDIHKTFSLLVQVCCCCCSKSILKCIISSEVSYHFFKDKIMKKDKDCMNIFSYLEEI